MMKKSNPYQIITLIVNITVGASLIWGGMYEVARVIQAVGYISKTLVLFREDLSSLHKDKADKVRVDQGFMVVKQDERDAQKQRDGNREAILELRKEVFYLRNILREKGIK